MNKKIVYRIININKIINKIQIKHKIKKILYKMIIINMIKFKQTNSFQQIKIINY